MVNPVSALNASEEATRRQEEKQQGQEQQGQQLPKASKMVASQTPSEPASERRGRREQTLAERAAEERAVRNSQVALQGLEEVLEKKENREQLPGKFLEEKDIVQSINLQKLGAEPGDRVVDGKLVREVSEKPRGEIITARDIAMSPTLKNIGAEPGDMVGEDNRLIKSAENAPFRNFLYGMKETTGPIEDFTRYLESVAPLGRITFDWENGIEFVNFDEEFKNATPQERRNLFKEYKEAELARERKTFEPGGGYSRILGNVAGATDLSILLPAGAGLRGLTLSGALYGMAAETGKELSETGELPEGQDLYESGVLGGAAGLAGAGVLKAARKIADRANKGKLKRQAEAEQQNFESEINAKVAAGENPARAAKNVQEDLGLSDARLKTISDLTGRKAKIPSTADKAKAAIRDDIASDSATLRQKKPTLDKYLGAIHTRVKNISPALAGRLRNFEAKTHIQTSKRLEKVQPFIKLLQRAPANVRTQLDRQLFNGNFDAARGLIRSYAPDEVQAFDDAIDTIKEIGIELKEVGYDNIGVGVEEAGNYFPRLVKDLEGLRNKIGAENRTQIEEALKLKARSKNIKIEQLSLEERAEVIDKVLRGYRPKTVDGSLSFTKPRVIEKISPDQQEFYEDAATTLQTYIRRATNDIEKRKFFGRAGQNADDGTLDTQSSIGRLIDQEIQKGNVTSQDEQVLQDIFSARFNGGERGAGPVNQWFRDVGYATTIANPYTAMINLDELSRSGAIYGLRNTLKSLFGKKYTNTIELGLLNASKEFENPERSARLLKKMFDASGFTKLDQLGKNATVNASIRKWMGKAKTEKGKQEIRKKYGAQFQDETEALIKDLQDGNVTDNVKTLAFSDLADLQPISRSELPQWYLENPNGRILYQLKSFTLKQYDLVRNQIVQEFKNGNRAEAVKKAATLMGYMTASGTGLGIVRDLMLGREVKPEDIPGRAMWALIAPYGANKYLTQRYISEGDIKGAVVEQVAPATPLLDDLFSASADVPEYLSGEKEPEVYNLIRNMPVVGKFVYSWLGGGAELFNERMEEQREEEE